MRTFLRVGTLIACFICCCGCHSTATKGAVVFVIEGLRIRSAPTMASETTEILSVSAPVHFLTQHGDPAAEINGISGKWRATLPPHKPGFIFDGFVSDLPAPPRNCSSLEMYAQSVGLTGPPRTSVSKAPDPQGYWSEETPLQSGLTFRIFQPWEGRGFRISSKSHSVREMFLLARLCVPSNIRSLVNQTAFAKILTKQGVCIPQPASFEPDGAALMGAFVLQVGHENEMTFADHFVTYNRCLK